MLRTYFSRKYFHLLRDAAIFAPCYIALDWASYIQPLGPFNITPWNPQPALAIVWMLLGGLRHAPVVAATIVLADALVRHAPGGYAITLGTALVLTAGYGAIAAALERLLRDPGLHGTRDLALFAAVVAAGSGLVATVFVGMLQLAGLLRSVPFHEAWLRFWVGDAVGILVTAPLLLAAADPRRRSDFLALARRPESWLQALALGATLWLIFAVFGEPARHFYLLFLPLVWIAVRAGMSGAVIATGVVQVGVVLAVHGPAIDLPVLELQVLVSALTLTGLFLGVVVDERRRVQAELAGSLRLAAAGEMAGAIAHEVNQPLTALTNYGRAAQMLVSRRDMARLEDIVSKMLIEAERASDVVRRLRDFFRAGATRLEAVEVPDVLAMGRRLAEKAIGERPIALETDAEAKLPALFVDRLQVELILRNLVANAVESLAAAAELRTGAARGRIRLAAEREDAEHVRIVVEDSGPGIAAAQREKLFQPFASGKPSGMGLGLAVSRAIAEAHGGTLEAAAAPHGEFHLVLPCTPGR
ncbi:MAG TPA: MASE1 domain-containing protein [Burkholderiales bacterium]|jgi:signal transduction histidine kinase|nr:MASE1 domain-containing protein [Burkholderiales bacterium]